MPKRAAPESKPVNPRKKDLKLAGFRLKPKQLEALQKEALRRAQERGSMKPDASELVREAVDMWLRCRGGKE